MVPRKHQVVFVAYGTREADLWRKRLPALGKVPGLQDDLHLSCWPDGGTRLRGNRWRHWISPLLYRADRLRAHLALPLFVAQDANLDPEITLIGWGKGCRVIQACLLRGLAEDPTVRHLRRIRQVVLISPSRPRRYRLLLAVTIIAMLAISLLELYRSLFGASIPAASTLVVLLGLVVAIATLWFGTVSNPTALELLDLRPAKLGRDDLEHQFRNHVQEGAKYKPGTWPIPCRLLDLPDFGEDEQIDTLQIAQAILEPASHGSVYEIDLFERHLTVSPVDGLVPDSDTPARDVAQIAHSVTFSERNSTNPEDGPAPWELRYQTYGGHIHVANIPDINRWTPQELSAYEYTHKQYVFRFFPEPGKTYTLKATVWNGFSAGNRDSHMHLRADAYFRCIRTSIDLRAYLRAGWRIDTPPEAYFFFGKLPTVGGKERDLAGPSCDCLKSNRSLQQGVPVEVTEFEPGVYVWEVREVRDGGILGFLFNVSPPEAENV